jgi:glycerol-3-phosphate dehydrogenase (NAD(P)+)
VSTTKVAHELAEMLSVDMPIVDTIYNVIYKNADIRESIIKLMRREGRPENEYIIEIKGLN